MQNQPIQEQAKPESKKIRFSKKYLLAGVSTVAVATAIITLIPSGHKPDSQTASVAAANLAENTNPVSSTDGYNITAASTTPTIVTNGTGSASAVDGQSSTTGSASQPQPASASPNPSMNDELSAIAAQIATMQNSLAANPNNVQLIRKQFYSLIYQMKNLISESDSDLSQEIQSSAQTLASQLNGMQSQLTNIQQLSQPGGYIDPSNLPFTIQFIDNVSGQPVVSVNYNSLLTPVSVGESLAGWTLVSADYASQYAVFQNSKDQLVKTGNNAASGGN